MNNNKEIIQVNISGDDKPGLTAALTSVLSKYDAFILDIGQANIHKSLTLGIMFETVADKSGFIMKDLLFEASRLGVRIKFTPISFEEYDAWVGRQGKNRYIVTLLGRVVSAGDIAEITGVVASYGLNIDAIRRLSGRKPLDVLDSGVTCIELSVRGVMTSAERIRFQEDLMEHCKSSLDISFQVDNIYRRSRRLVCFDMDSTLASTECIDELAKRAGVGDKVSAITASAMRGEIPFKESFRRRVALLEGLDASVMKEIAENLPFNEGLERMMRVLKRVGYKTAILSGGFTYFANYAKEKFGFDYIYANELEVKDGKFTGRYIGDIVDGEFKAAKLRELCELEGIDLSQAVAVGDGANDLPMLGLAGLGIAYHAKPRVKATADQRLSSVGLEGILYFLGLKDSQVDP